MKCLLIVTLVSVNLAAVVSLSCDEGWSFYADDNKCIKLFEEELYWGQAQSKCENEFGRMITIPDLKTQEFVNKLVGNESSMEYWLGLNDMDNEGRFMWSDGTPACNFQYWGPGEPNNALGEDCAHLFTEPTHHWNDKDCDMQSPYICEKRGPGCEYQNGGCPGVCTDAGHDSKAWAVTCSCKPGFAAYNGKCVDINECSIENGGCNQVCTDKAGYRECSCFPDFVLVNGTQCVLDNDETIIG